MRKVVAFFRDRKRRRRLQRAREDASAEQKDVLGTLRTWFVNAGIAFAVIAFGVAILAVVMEVIEDSITIESFSVPPSFDEQGYTGRVLALRLIDELGDMNRQVERDVPRKSFTADWQRKAIDLPVPQMNTNLHAVVSVIRQIIGVEEQSFTCEIVNGNAGALRVRARLTGRAPFAADYAAGTSIDAIIRDLAGHFCKQSQPVLYAAVECKRPGELADKECASTMQRIMRTSGRIDATWALKFLGDRQKTTDRADAIRTYTVAIRIGCGQITKETKIVCAYLYANRGTTWDEESQPKLAVKDLEKAKSIRPQDSGVLTNLGVAYDHDQKKDLALAAYSAAAAASPRDVSPLVYRGLSQYSRDALQEALADFNRAIQLNPTYANAYLSRARVFQRQQDRDAAERDFQTAVLLDKNKLPEVEQLRGIELAQVSPLEMRP